MPREFFDRTPEQQNVILIDAATLCEAERLVEACERCRPNDAEIPFDVILDHVTASDPSVTDYILQEPAKCPMTHRPFPEVDFNVQSAIDLVRSSNNANYSDRDFYFHKL